MNVGLNKLCEVVLEKDIEKSKSVTLGKWNNRKLGEGQVQYVCVDAYVVFKIGKVLKATSFIIF